MDNNNGMDNGGGYPGAGPPLIHHNLEMIQERPWSDVSVSSFFLYQPYGVAPSHLLCLFFFFFSCYELLHHITSNHTTLILLSSNPNRKRMSASSEPSRCSRRIIDSFQRPLGADETKIRAARDGRMFCILAFHEVRGHPKKTLK